MHGHCAIDLIVAGLSAAVNGQASHVLTVAGRSATVGTVAKNVGVINILCMLLSLSVSVLIDNIQENKKFCRCILFYFQEPSLIPMMLLKFTCDSQLLSCHLHYKTRYIVALCKLMVLISWSCAVWQTG